MNECMNKMILKNAECVTHVSLRELTMPLPSEWIGFHLARFPRNSLFFPSFFSLFCHFISTFFLLLSNMRYSVLHSPFPYLHYTGKYLFYLHLNSLGILYVLCVCAGATQSDGKTIPEQPNGMHQQQRAEKKIYM